MKNIRSIPLHLIFCGIYIGFLCLIMNQILFISPLLPPHDSPLKSTTLTPNHEPIVIIGDENFTSENGVSSGDGSITNPYLIKDLIITESKKTIYNINNGTVEAGIFIINSSKYVILQNISCDNASIKIYDTLNVAIYNSSIENVQNALILDNVTDSSIIENKITNIIGNGIFSSGFNLTFLKNTIQNISFADAFTIYGNNHKIIQNIIFNCSNSGIYLKGNNCIFENNYISNIPNQAGIFLSENHYPILKNNIIDKCSLGIGLYSLFNGIIYNNSISNTKSNAINIGSSSSNISITQNNIFQNIGGIKTSYASKCLISLNNIFQNKEGIVLDKNTTDTIIWGNNIYSNWGNNTSIKDFDGSQKQNIWYKDQIGNYYGDYTTKYPYSPNNGFTWETPYPIPGGTDVDYYPLVDKFPPILETPQLSIAKSTSNNGTLNLNWSTIPRAVTYSIYRASLNITSVQGLTPLITGITTTSFSNTGLANGTYYYVVVAVHQWGQSNCSNCVMGIVALDQDSGSDSDNPSDTKDSFILDPSYLPWIGVGGIAVIGGLGFIIYRKKNTISF